MLQEVLALFSASFQKSGLNDENLDIFGFQVFSKMQQRAEGRQCTPWDHSTSVFVVVVRIQKSLSCCTIIHKIKSLWDN